MFTRLINLPLVLILTQGQVVVIEVKITFENLTLHLPTYGRWKYQVL